LRRTSDTLSWRADLLHDVSTLALLALVLVPFYMLLNQYWKSLVLLAAVYGVLGLAFLRLGRHMRRVMRRLPAEIPPWHATSLRESTPAQFDVQFGAAEAIQHTYRDPHYLQEVLKPRLQRLLMYRLSGSPDTPLDTLDATRLAHIEPAVVEMLQRREATGLWARYRLRRQRLRDVLITLRHLETL
jgi:hypothetical protein